MSFAASILFCRLSAPSDQSLSAASSKDDCDIVTKLATQITSVHNIKDFFEGSSREELEEVILELKTAMVVAARRVAAASRRQ